MFPHWLRYYIGKRKANLRERCCDRLSNCLEEARVIKQALCTSLLNRIKYCKPHFVCVKYTLACFDAILSRQLVDVDNDSSLLIRKLDDLEEIHLVYLLKAKNGFGQDFHLFFVSPSPLSAFARELR